MVHVSLDDTKVLLHLVKGKLHLRVCPTPSTLAPLGLHTTHTALDDVGPLLDVIDNVPEMSMKVDQNFWLRLGITHHPYCLG